jgi:hypothetical protein
MDEDQIREIIREEMETYLSQAKKAQNANPPPTLQSQTSKTVVEKSLQVLDGKNIQLGRANGTMIGTDSDQKIGFYGTTPVAKQGAITAPTGGTTVDSQSRTAIASIIAALKAIGITN